MKILVIDDTQKHLDSAIKTLEGHDVQLCSSYDEALRILESLRYRGEKFDAVLSDLQLPVGEHTHGQRPGKRIGELMPFGFTLALTAVRSGVKYVGCMTDANHHDDVASSMFDSLDNPGDKHAFSIDGATVIFTNHCDFINLEGTEETYCHNCYGHGREIHWHDENSNDHCFCEKGDVCKECNGSGKMIVKKRGKHWGKLLARIIKGK